MESKQINRISKITRVAIKLGDFEYSLPRAYGHSFLLQHLERIDKNNSGKKLAVFRSPNEEGCPYSIGFLDGRGCFLSPAQARNRLCITEVDMTPETLESFDIVGYFDKKTLNYNSAEAAEYFRAYDVSPKEKGLFTANNFMAQVFRRDGLVLDYRQTNPFTKEIMSDDEVIVNGDYSFFYKEPLGPNRTSQDVHSRISAFLLAHQIRK